MKVLLLISLCIATAAVGHSVPLDSNTKEIRELNAILESAVQNKITANEDDQNDDQLLFDFQELLASKQSTHLAAQGWLRRAWNHGRKIYKVWNKYKKQVCAKGEGMPAEFEDAMAEAFFEQHQTAILQSLEEVEANSDEAESEVSSDLKDFLAAHQDLPVELQGFFKKIWKRAKKLVGRGVNFGRKVYNTWNKFKKGISCEQSADMPEELENAVVEAYMKQNAEDFTLEALKELIA